VLRIQKRISISKDKISSRRTKQMVAAKEASFTKEL